MTSRAAVLLLPLAAAGALIAGLLMPNPATGADIPAAASPSPLATLSGPPAPSGTGVGPDLAVLDAAAPGTEALTPEQATEAIYAADRVCEAITSQVPAPEIRAQVAEEGGLDPEAAAAFVSAALGRC